MTYFENPKVVFEASHIFHAVWHWTMDWAYGNSYGAAKGLWSPLPQYQHSSAIIL